MWQKYEHKERSCEQRNLLLQLCANDSCLIKKVLRENDLQSCASTGKEVEGSLVEKDVQLEQGNIQANTSVCE